jgi:hypothetical protein
MIGVMPAQFTVFADAFASSNAFTSSISPDFTAREREEYMDLSALLNGVDENTRGINLLHEASNWELPDIFCLV